MGLNDIDVIGQTPLDDEEIDELIPPINSREMLNEVEQENIESAIEWTRKISPSLGIILSEAFIRRVHKRMFGNVWKWAGIYRSTNKNIGVDKYEVSSSLRTLCDDCRYWIEHSTFEPDEIAVRFKHRIVLIHPFPNGNGRHSRLIGDILIDKYFKRDVFSWGSRNLVNATKNRITYINALKKADEGNYTDLLLFARS